MKMAKYPVDNKAAITTMLKEMKNPTLVKLELEKERLYKSLDGLPLSEKLEVHGLISDVRLRIWKLSIEFDIALAKELFTRILVEEKTYFYYLVCQIDL